MTSEGPADLNFSGQPAHTIDWLSWRLSYVGAHMAVPAHFQPLLPYEAVYSRGAARFTSCLLPEVARLILARKSAEHI